MNNKTVREMHIDVYEIDTPRYVIELNESKIALTHRDILKLKDLINGVITRFFTSDGEIAQMECSKLDGYLNKLQIEKRYWHLTKEDVVKLYDKIKKVENINK